MVELVAMVAVVARVQEAVALARRVVAGAVVAVLEEEVLAVEGMKIRVVSFQWRKKYPPLNAGNHSSHHNPRSRKNYTKSCKITSRNSSRPMGVTRATWSLPLHGPNTSSISGCF